MGTDTDAAYWDTYSAIQNAKHELLRSYLGGWFPILASLNGDVVYVDSHAGRGRHAGGEEGSPLVAIKTLLKHKLKGRILTRNKVSFVFMEKDSDNAVRLRSEIAGLGDLPSQVAVQVIESDFATEIRKLLGDLEESSQQLAPAFFFVDPYGYDLPMDLMQRVLSWSRTELLVNLMVRYVDMGMSNAILAPNVTKLFGTDEWHRVRAIEDPTERYSAMASFYGECLGCGHCSVLEMRGPHREPKYALIHATNHRRGRELMKDAMWKVSGGSYVIYQAHDPRQMSLIQGGPDLSELKRQLVASFSGQVPYGRLKDWTLESIWRYPHLNEALKELRKEGKVSYSGFFKQEPQVTFQQ